MDQQQNTEAPHGAVPLDCSVRAQFEEWAKERGLIAVSHGIRSENSALGAYWEAWQAATKAERESLVITTTRTGECVLVSRQDEEGRILSVIWESEGPYGAHEAVRSNVGVKAAAEGSPVD